ncbi:MAG: hypothetical protein NC453_09170 [Muribaculum sp.]|nr:hypothetical protein [Muribaculum sp.]
MKIKQLLYLFSLFATLVAGCSSDEPQMAGKVEKQEIKLDVKSRAVCDKLSDFYIRFTSDVLKMETETGNVSNIIVSPLSASMALGMLANGVEDSAVQQIYTYLGTDDINSLNNLSLSLTRELPVADQKSTLAMANSVWYNKTFSLCDRFKTVMRDYYAPEIQPISFYDGDKAKIAVNNWIERKTSGLINKFNDWISPDTEVMLLNTLYFKSIWEEEFFKEVNTSNRVFHGANGDSNVEFMGSYKTNFMVSISEYFKAVKLPFGNGAFTLTIIVPKEYTAINDIEENLNSNQIKELNENYFKKDVIINLPKFKISTTTDLTKLLNLDCLSSLKCAEYTIFNETLPKLITTFKQGCSFQIDEKGVESAAVSQIGSWTSANLGSLPENWVIDRPFYFLINEYSTGACLLSGRISDL